MKKLLFFLMGIALLGVSCQQDENIHNATNGDTVEVTIGVGVPELATRSGETDMNSGRGAIDNFTADEWAKYDVRYILEVYEVTDGHTNLDTPIKKREIKTYDQYEETMFSVRLVPNRNYRFVVWADFVNEGSEDDLYYNTSDLNAITRTSAATAMDECQDAYFIKKDLFVGGTGISESLILKRPFGKIRVITTDYDEVNIGSEPAKVEVKFYNHKLLTTLNAVTGVANGETINEYTYDITKESSPYTQGYDEVEQNMTLFADYILAADETVGAQEVNFTIEVTGKDGRVINSHDFNTQIPLERNHLTTIVGNLLTLQNDITISIDDNFDGEYIRNWDDEAVTLASWSAGQLNANGNYTFELNDGANNFTLIVPQSAINQTTGKLSPVGAAEFVASEDDLTANTFTIEGLMVEPTRAAASATVTSGTMKVANWEDGVHVQFDLWYSFDAETDPAEYKNIRFDFKGAVMAKTSLETPVVTASVNIKEITLTWAAVEGAAKYSITNGTELPVITDKTEYTFTGDYATTYTFAVVAIPENDADYYPSNAAKVIVTTEELKYEEITVESIMTGYVGNGVYSLYFYTPNHQRLYNEDVVICSFLTKTNPTIFVEGEYGFEDFDHGSSKYSLIINGEGYGGKFETINVKVTKVADFTFEIDGTFTATRSPATVYHFNTTYTTPKLSTPSNVKAEVENYKDVVVTWDSVVRAIGYRVSVNGSEAQTVTEPKFEFTGVYNSEYTISIVAFSESNPDSDVATATIKTEADPYIYLKPNSNWLIDNARFAVYTWDKNQQGNEKWVSLTAVGDGTYKVLRSELNNDIIFCRMNPNATANNWSNKWNQTSDLTLPTDGKNLYTVRLGTWDNGGGTWSVK